MRRLERVFALIIFETYMVSGFDFKITKKADALHNIFKTDERSYRYKRSGVESQDCEDEIKERGLTLINFGIKTLDPTITIPSRFYDAVKDLYNVLERKKETMKDKVLKYLEPEFPILRSKLYLETNFQKSFIFAYTTKYGYEDLNKALRDHNCATKTLTESDKALAPYAAALMAILMHWNELDSTTGKTYRGATVTENDFNTYHSSNLRSRSIVWLNFASSSTDKKKAFKKNGKFIINNKNAQDSRWKPKLICECSRYYDECEALYPPGSAFNVDKVTKDGQDYKIYLTLRENQQTVSWGRKRRSVSTDPASKMGFCYINSSLSCQINMWNVLVLGIIGKFVAYVLL